MRVSLGRNSPSFIIGILLLVAIAGLYVWRASRPHPRGASDVIVREFVEVAQKDVRSGRRAIDRAADRIRNGAALDDVIQSIESAAQETIKNIEVKAQQAIDRLEEIDEITLKTEQNRRNRIRMRLDEMRQTITEAQSDATANARTHAEGQAAK
jgi:hypothetical protein